MANETLVSDELWEAIEPYLPPPRVRGGRPRIPDRAALAGIVYVLRRGLRWRAVPAHLGCGSGVTCWRRFRRWQALGVWEAVHRTVLNWLGLLDANRWERASLDRASVRAKRGEAVLRFGGVKHRAEGRNLLDAIGTSPTSARAAQTVLRMPRRCSPPRRRPVARGR